MKRKGLIPDDMKDKFASEIKHLDDHAIQEARKIAAFLEEELIQPVQYALNILKETNSIEQVIGAVSEIYAKSTATSKCLGSFIEGMMLRSMLTGDIDPHKVAKGFPDQEKIVKDIERQAFTQKATVLPKTDSMN